MDTLVDAMPPSLRVSEAGIGFAEGGEVVVGEAFRTLDAAWADGIAAMARAGARIVVDDVFLGGPESQRRWRKALEGLDVLWVGIRCDAEVAAAREIARGDRPSGMGRGPGRDGPPGRGLRPGGRHDPHRIPDLRPRHRRAHPGHARPGAA